VSVTDPDELYGLPLEQFVPERTALAKALRADGKRDDATAVTQLHKPSVAAWAVNQLVRTQKHETQALFDAGERLIEAQAGLLEGRGDGATLREAMQAERTAVEELLQKARGLLSSQGQELTATMLERVSDTLHAAALDPYAREQVQAGTLERELRHVGLGAAQPGTAAPKAGTRKPATTKTKAGGTARRDHEQELREQAAREREAEQERAERRKHARQAERAARREAEHAARAVKAAQQKRDAAAQALDEADQSLAAAQERAADADAALGAARTAVAETAAE
jgi:hypothetical protein